MSDIRREMAEDELDRFLENVGKLLEDDELERFKAEAMFELREL